MKDIKKLKKEILIRDDRIASEREQESIILANLGQSVYSSGSADVEALKDLKNSVSGMDKEIQGLEDSLRRLLVNEEKRAAGSEEMKSLKVELRNIKNKEEPLFEELGRSGWELWKSGGSIHENMEKALEDLIKAEARLQAAEEAVFRTEHDPGNRAVRLLTKSKAFFLAGRRKTASSALDRLWNRAGEKLQKQIPSDVFTGTPAALPASTLEALDKRREEIIGKLSDLKQEIEALDNELEKMPGKGGGKRRVSWIESSLEDKHNELEDVFRELGRLWLEQSGGKSSDTAVEKRRKEWLAVNRRIRKIEEEQNAFRAHIEYLEISRSGKDKADQVELKAEEVKNRQAELKALKKELSSIEKKLAARKENLPELPGKNQT